MGNITSNGKKTIVPAIFHLEEILLSPKSVCQEPLMCLRCEMTCVERDKHTGSVYIRHPFTTGYSTSPLVLTRLPLQRCRVHFQLSKVLKHHIQDFSLIAN